MSFYVSTGTFVLLHCDEWDRVVALLRHKFVTGATLLQLRYVYCKTTSPPFFVVFVLLILWFFCVVFYRSSFVILFIFFSIFCFLQLTASDRILKLLSNFTSIFSKYKYRKRNLCKYVICKSHWQIKDTKMAHIGLHIMTVQFILNTLQVSLECKIKYCNIEHVIQNIDLIWFLVF